MTPASSIAIVDCSPPPRTRVDDRATRRTRWIWPETAELIYGTIASIIIFGLLVWKLPAR